MDPLLQVFLGGFFAHFCRVLPRVIESVAPHMQAFGMAVIGFFSLRTRCQGKDLKCVRCAVLTGRIGQAVAEGIIDTIHFEPDDGYDPAENVAIVKVRALKHPMLVAIDGEPTRPAWRYAAGIGIDALVAIDPPGGDGVFRRAFEMVPADSQRYCNLTSGNSFGAGAMSPCRGRPRQGRSTLVFHGVAKPPMEKREWTDTRIRRSRPSWNI
jgi:hypothetical protein